MSLFEKMLVDLPFSRAEFWRLTRTAPHRYKVYSIPKRSSGGYRVIAQPAAELKLVQRWVVDHVLNGYPLHDAAMAYREGRGIKENARRHAHHTYLLKLDFLNFFPTIKANDFSLHTSKYAKEFESDLPILENILFRRPRGQNDLVLSIGAPSSPLVSNSILYDFDMAVSEYAAIHNVTYTRYADDLVFSTDKAGILTDLHHFVIRTCEVLSYPRLLLNYEKTIFASKKGNRTVTGLILTNDGQVSIGHSRKRKLRTLIHRYEYGKLEEAEIIWLRGYLAFVRDVEPTLYKNLMDKARDTTQAALFRD